MAESKTQKAIVVEKPGAEIKLGHIPIPKPGSNQVLVKIAYTPVNPSDIMAANGDYNAGFTFPFVSGWEASGIVEEVGPDCKIQHKVGDRVSANADLLNYSKRGVWAEYAVFNSENVWTLPADVSLEEAHSHQVNPVTAILEVKAVKKIGCKAAIQTAAGSALGRMFIKLCKEEGIKTINLVRRDEHVKELKEIGADFVINIQNKDWPAELKKIAEENDARVCFEYVAGDVASEIIKVMPSQSTLYLAGNLSRKNLSFGVFDMSFSELIITVFGYIFPYLELTAEERRKMGERIVSELKTTFKTDVAKTFKFEEVKEAIDYTNNSKGKAVFKNF